MTMQFTPVSTTHFKGCWKYHGDCAIKKIDELLHFLKFVKGKKLDPEVIKNILEG